jgi:ribonuclease BN (tRNA processing enzyme)
MTAAARLTVLGCAGTHVSAERMCSSYLVEAEGYRLVLDLGNGSLSNLQGRMDVSEIDAVIISHLHADHFADVYSLYYALRFHPDGPLSVPVYAPEGALQFTAQLLSGDDTFKDTVRFHVAKAGDMLSLGPFKITLYEGNHPVETLASRVEHGGRVLAYSGDSAATPALTECARSADLFVCDSSWLERQRPLPEGVHMTGLEAGRQAAAAGARRLLITHVFPRNDAHEVAAEAASAFPGEILVAHDLMEIPL